MLIRELMMQPPVVVNEDTPLGEVAQAMLAHHAACAAVIDDRGELSGIVTEDDFAPEEHLVPFSTERVPMLFGEWMPKRGIERMYEAARGLKAKDLMKAPAVAVDEDTPVEEALVRMQRYAVRCIPVVRGNVPVGTFSHQEMLLLMI